MTPMAARGKFQRQAESPGQSLQQLTQRGGDYSQIKLINSVSGSGSGCSEVTPCVAVGVFSWSLCHGDVAVPLHTSGSCRSCVGAAGGAF